MSRFVAAVAGMIILSVSTPSVALSTLGDMACPKWTSNRADAASALRSRSWLVGYMTGLAVASQTDVLRDADAESIALWIPRRRLAGRRSRTCATRVVSTNEPAAHERSALRGVGPIGCPLRAGHVAERRQHDGRRRNGQDDHASHCSDGDSAHVSFPRAFLGPHIRSRMKRLQGHFNPGRAHVRVSARMRWPFRCRGRRQHSQAHAPRHLFARRVASARRSAIYVPLQSFVRKPIASRGFAMDLIIRRAATARSREPVDIGIEAGRIVAVEPRSGRHRAARKSTPTVRSSRRPSSTRISTWTRRCPTACRA